MKNLIDMIVLRLLGSRRVVLLMATGIVTIVTFILPELAPLRDELFTIAAVFILVIVSGLTTRQATEIAKESVPTYADYDLRDLLREIVQEVLEEALNTEN